MRTIFLIFLISFINSFVFASTKTILKADILEGNVWTQELIGAKGHFEKNANGWNGFDDGASSSPVDGTGGTVTTTCTRTTSTPIDGDGSFLFTKSAANYQGEGCSLDFTIPANLSATVLRGSFEYAISSGTYADDAVQIWIYNVTDSTLIQPAPTKIKNHSLFKQPFDFEFQPTYSTTSKTYRVILHIAATDTNAYTIKIDNWKIGAYPKNYGSPITDAIAYTPTFTGFGTVTNINVKSQRIGDSLRVFGYFQTGTNTGVEARMTLGYGGVNGNVNIDTNKIGNTVIIGSAGSTESGSATYFLTAPLSGTTNYIKWGRQTSTTTVTTAALGNSWTNSVYISFDLIVPISGWSSQAIMSSDANTSIVSAIISGDPASATSGNPIIVPTVIYDSTGSYNPTTGRYTCSTPGVFKLYGALQSASSATTLTIYKNGVSNSLAGNLDSNGEATFNSAVNCVAGDLIDLRPGGTVDATSMTLNIEKITGPSQIAASDSVSALYTGAPPTGTLTSAYNTTTFGTKRKDSHNAYSGGTYIVPVSGTYSIQAQTRHDATYSAGNTAGTALFINGVQYETGVVNASGAAVTMWPLLTVHGVPLLAGDLVTIRSYDNGTSPTFGSNSNQNFFSIVRTGNY